MTGKTFYRELWCDECGGLRRHSVAMAKIQEDDYIMSLIICQASTHDERTRHGRRKCLHQQVMCCSVKDWNALIMTEKWEA